MFQQFKDWYEMGLFTVQDERNGVLTGWITKDEYKQITGQDYDQQQLAQLKHSRFRNTQYINKPHSNERGFYYGRLLKGGE